MRIYLVISQIIYVLALFPWFVAFIMSPMAFDAGFSAWNITFVTVLAGYPVAVITSSILAWTLRRKRPRVSIWVNLIPTLWIIGTVVVLVSSL